MTVYGPSFLPLQDNYQFFFLSGSLCDQPVTLTSIYFFQKFVLLKAM